MSDAEPKDQAVRISMRSGRRAGKYSGEVHLCNLSDAEVQLLESLTLGQHYVYVERGRLVARPVHEGLPAPVPDLNMTPFWHRASASDLRVDHRALLPKEKIEHHMPSLMIQHLCGYAYTPGNYRRVATLLEECGFECLRSRRGTDGRYYEIWWLGGFYAAEGPLRAVAEDRTPNEAMQVKMDRVVSWLCSHAEFGTLDIVIQRAAMVID